MSAEYYWVYRDDVGNTYADIKGVAADKVQVTLSGGMATVITPTAEPVGELMGVEISDAGHIYYRADGKFTPIGVDHGAPSRGIVHQLSTDENGNLFTFAQGRYLATTVVA